MVKGVEKFHFFDGQGHDIMPSSYINNVFKAI